MIYHAVKETTDVTFDELLEVAPDRGGEGALPKIVDGMGKAFPPLSAPGAAVQIAVRARVRGSRREAGDGLLSLS
jgi:hypothetical protein